MQENGTFITKVFRGRDVGKLYAFLTTMFKEVYCAKPKASRNSSYESFIVAKGFMGEHKSLGCKGHLLALKPSSVEEEKKVDYADAYSMALQCEIG